MMTSRNRLVLRAAAVVLLLGGCSANTGTGITATASSSPSPTPTVVASVPAATSTDVAPTSTSATAEPDATLGASPDTVPSSYYEALSSESCANIIGGYLRACTAYVLNATYLSLVPFYQLGTSKNVTLATSAKRNFEYRYDGQARKLIEDRIAGWPTPNLLGVNPPHISIVAIKLSADEQTATLTTIEKWKVFTTNQRPIFTENATGHTVTMKKAPDGLHRWVVTTIR